MSSKFLPVQLVGYGGEIHSLFATFITATRIRSRKVKRGLSGFHGRASGRWFPAVVIAS
jgi:hypothetical protein